MKVLNGLEELRERYRAPVITVGNFDGLHLGHQALIGKVVERAQAIGGTSLVMTFEPHPMRVLRPAVNLPLITTCQRKLEMIEACGVSLVLVVRFDQDFARLSADDFVDKLLAGRLRVAEVVVGHDFSFGHKGLGDIDLLRSKGRDWGFRVHALGPVLVDGRPVSSTRVRQAVRAGDMAAARRLLGRHYHIRNLVERGYGRGGRLLGFPTANLKLSGEMLPRLGVYAVLVKTADDVLRLGVTNIGTNPTFDDGAPSVETYILDFDRDLYGQSLEVLFVKRLRDEKRFAGPQELARQIRADVELARQVLAAELRRPQETSPA